MLNYPRRNKNRNVQIFRLFLKFPAHVIIFESWNKWRNRISAYVSMRTTPTIIIKAFCIVMREIRRRSHYRENIYTATSSAAILFFFSDAQHGGVELPFSLRLSSGVIRYFFCTRANSKSTFRLSWKRFSSLFFVSILNA